ncbi:DUF6783 domain-containing protein [Eisenbergiella sp.]|uniref:DUF6783 domain-containing protein n=1 Tax=Eisenbergiella sp. TaxID=1924109 RepID=UPI003FA4B5C9
MWDKFHAKWGVQIVEMNFQTRSRPEEVYRQKIQGWESPFAIPSLPYGFLVFPKHDNPSSRLFPVPASRCCTVFPPYPESRF